MKINAKTIISLAIAVTAVACAETEFEGRPKMQKKPNSSENALGQPLGGDGPGADNPDDAIDFGRTGDDDASFGGGKILDDSDGFDNGFITDGSDSSVQVPRFGMLLNNLECASCHLTVNGNVASTSPVNSWSPGHAAIANEIYNGDWFASSTWSNVTRDPTIRYPINIAGTAQVKENYKGRELPADLNSDGRADFPQLDLIKAQSKVTGVMTGVDQNGQSVKVQRVHPTNLVITGTKSNPIKVAGEILVSGDLVIKGYYTGVGTIYATGNIYVPGNLIAVDSPFPFPNDKTAALITARRLVAKKKGDALGLATPKSILLGDLKTSLFGLENYDDWARAVDADPNRTPQQKAAEKQAQLDILNKYRRGLEVDHVYSWFNGGKDAYERLYDIAISCLTGNTTLKDTTIPNKGSINLVEAYLYAAKMVGGISRQSSWAINGGVIADEMHIIGRAGANAPGDANGAGKIEPCPATVNPVHGLPSNRNYINYDYRMAAGLQILRSIAPYFKGE